ncbi:uncharacterized protein LOC62_06G007993 [Vanrija pseudolonga]|uniref:Methyltransferase domain-containing protein n=1 Tax=Vanrija pseudolonga TaxID=143232 RepID=A0AAF0YIB1_9TREE|nr:hypothetical protein LOC62_06G007993 [Vanrija pseudolonga]
MGRPKTPIKFGIFGHSSGGGSHHGGGHDSAAASAATSRASSVHSGHQPSVYSAFAHPLPSTPPTPAPVPGPTPALSVKTAPPALLSVKGVPQGWTDDLSVALPVPVVLPPTPVPGQFPPSAPSVAVYAGGKAKGSAVNPGAAWAAWEREHLAAASRSEAELGGGGSSKRRGASGTLASLTPRAAPGATSKHVSDGAVDPDRRHHDHSSNLFGSLSRRASRMASLRVPRSTALGSEAFGSNKSAKGRGRPHTTGGSSGHTWSSSGAFASAGFAAPFGMLSTAPTESEASVATSGTDFSNLFTRAREGSTRTSQSVHHYRPSDISLDCATPTTTEAFSSWETSAPVCESPAVLSAEGAAAMPLLPATQEGWYEPPTPRGAGGVRRIWRAADGREVRAIYKVGYERAVLDLEARLHETMYEVANGRHSFVDADEPGLVLDLGTGTGLWPISAALQWPETNIVGADIVPVQIDLDSLVAAEVRARTSSAGTAAGAGMWASVASRIKFEQYNFLDGLPYQCNTFDMVHMRFLGLGVPETRWAELLDEAMRIVEMSFEAPPTAPPSVSNTFSSLLLSDYVQPNPLFALQLHLPATHGVAAGATRPVFSDTFAPPSGNMFAPDNAPGALADAAMTWIRSALEYKGTAFVKASRTAGSDGDRAGRVLAEINPARWPYTPPESPAETPTEGTRISLAAWVVHKEI